MADPLGFDSYPVSRRKANLKRANASRKVIAKMRADLKARKLDPYGLIAGDGGKLEAVVQKSKISTLLMMVPGVGPVTRDELLAELGVTSDTRFTALTYERRKALADLLRAVLEPDGNTDLNVPTT